MAPTRTIVGVADVEATRARSCTVAVAVAESLWRSSEAAACGWGRGEFEEMLLAVGQARNFGLPEQTTAQADEAQQAKFFEGLHMTDLVLARACAMGKEPAWERFIALYRAPLLRAAIAIAGQECPGRELADRLYAELYGLTEREGERRCPLNSYSGRGSLMGWLRTILAQRHVDDRRRIWREEPLDEAAEAEFSRIPSQGETGGDDSHSLWVLGEAVGEAVASQDDEDRLLLASYFLDGRTLHQIAAVMGVHEATVCRRIKRTTAAVRKQLIRNLVGRGWSRRQADEALETDPRDLSGSGWLGLYSKGTTNGEGEPERRRWKELLQRSARNPFKEQAEP